MTLRDNEYKIMDDGIWLPKKVLEELQEHYCEVADKNKKDWIIKGDFKYPFYLGKADVYRDLLKHFEELVEDEV